MTPTLPPLSSRWVRDLTGDVVVGEPRSTCADCPMCVAGGPFRVDVKCCGYHPRLPNYLVGAALVGGSAGAVRTRARLAQRVGVTPLFLTATPERALAQTSTGFGTDPDLICPWYSAGSCTIWAARDAVCSTWWCQIDDGPAGVGWWDSLRALLQSLQSLVARQVAVDVGARPPTGWGSHEPASEDYFLQCYLRAEALTLADLRRIGGLELRHRVRELALARRERERARAGGPTVG